MASGMIQRDVVLGTSTLQERQVCKLNVSIQERSSQPAIIMESYKKDGTIYGIEFRANKTIAMTYFNGDSWSYLFETSLP